MASLLFFGLLPGWLKWQVFAYHTCRDFTFLTPREKLGPVHSSSYWKTGTASFAISSLQDVYPSPLLGYAFWLMTTELLIRHLHFCEITLPLWAFFTICSNLLGSGGEKDVPWQQAGGKWISASLHKYQPTNANFHEGLSLQLPPLSFCGIRILKGDATII